MFSLLNQRTIAVRCFSCVRHRQQLTTKPYDEARQAAPLRRRNRQRKQRRDDDVTEQAGRRQEGHVRLVSAWPARLSSFAHFLYHYYGYFHGVRLWLFHSADLLRRSVYPCPDPDLLSCRCIGVASAYACRHNGSLNRSTQRGIIFLHPCWLLVVNWFNVTVGLRLCLFLGRIRLLYPICGDRDTVSGVENHRRC